MSDHYAKMYQMALDANNAKLNTPEIRAEVDRVYQAIESAAKEGLFYCTVVKSNAVDAEKVRQILTREGYGLTYFDSNKYEVSWNIKK